MKITEILDTDQLDDEVAAGNVTLREHPTYPYLIANYTDQCAYDRNWNDVTLMCRGLIWNAETRELLARPFPKFFNHHEPDAPTIPDSASVEVSDKMDGSLGIIYREPDGQRAIATRGSFASDQALHATERLREKYPDFRPLRGITFLFEIVYPENRIVLDYGSTDDLYLLATVHNETGKIYGPSETPYTAGIHWTGPRTKTFGYFNYGHFLKTHAPRKNAEGVVVRANGSDEMVKFKQEDYVAIHRIVTGLTPLRVWEMLTAEQPISEVLVAVPEEFHDWINGMVKVLKDEFHDIYWKAHAIYEGLQHIEDRKQFALELLKKNSPYQHLVFKLRDGGSLDQMIWKMVRPKSS